MNWLKINLITLKIFIWNKLVNMPANNCISEVSSTSDRQRVQKNGITHAIS